MDDINTVQLPDIPTYTGLKKTSQQQEALYDSAETSQYEMYPIPLEKALSSKQVPESKQVVPRSNVQHHSNGSGNQKERVKWLIVMILLITSTLLNVIIVIAYFTKETSCSSQVINTTQMAQDSTQTTMILQHNINDSITTLTALVNNDITALIDRLVDNTQSLNGTIKNLTASLQQITTTQSILENITNENEGTINNILVNVLKNQNESLIFSCQDIKNIFPTIPSGYYHVNGQLVYCEMGELCGSDEGWTRIGYLDMTDSTVDCPEGFKLFVSNGTRTCVRPGQEASCESVKFGANGVSYSEVCGRVVGYQSGSTDAVSNEFISVENHNDINSFYVDGVSITQGHPRKHVWTLMAGISDEMNEVYNCPCNDPPGNTQELQSFIGNDYFCESGNHGKWEYIFYHDDPLWDGDGCGSKELQCCSAHPTLPWFHKTYNSSTTDYIELRLCGDQKPIDEDAAINQYEIYVK